MRATPSSVAFCTMKSIRSPRGTHCIRVRRQGDSRSMMRAAPIEAETREPRTASMVPINSRPSPLNSTSSSPLRARSTFARCAPVSRARSTMLPGCNAPSTYTRVRRVARPRLRLAFICAQLSHMLTVVSETRGSRLQVDLDTGLMRGARQVASPNYDARPAGVEADLIVVHGISLPPGDFGGPWIDRLFTNTLPAEAHPYFEEVASLRVSSHLVVMRGGAVSQYVKFTERAWHAGKSAYRGREACNDFSVGVELEGTDTLPYEAAQYGVLAQV